MAPRRAPAGTTCLLTTSHPDRGLSYALVQHLAQEMPAIEFQLAARGGAQGTDSIWLCGYEAGHARAITQLRQRFPGAVLLVTGRDSLTSFGEEALAAGADFARAWPVEYGELERMLQGLTPADPS